MLCQNCKRQEASIHLKRIVNGESVELHLCGDCAAGLGYGDLFSGFGLDPGRVFAAAGRGSVSRIGSRRLRCETCGLSLEDIAQTSRVGCPDCYAAFGDKLLPLLQKLHGKAAYKGKTPLSAGDGDGGRQLLNTLRLQLEEALRSQDPVRAAAIRAKIRALTEGEGEV